MSETHTKYLTAESRSGGKFWEVRVDGDQMSVRYGKIGQDKAWKTTTLTNHEAAMREADKKVRAKLSKGYAESTREGASEAPAPAATFEEDFGALRSELEQKPTKGRLGNIKRIYERMFALDAARTGEEVDPYLTDKLSTWPDRYFAHKVEQVGVKGTWPRAAAPIRDDAALAEAPFSRFSRELLWTFNGQYRPGDDVEVSDYDSEHWVASGLDTHALTTNQVGRRLRRLELRYNQLCEIQQYMCPVHVGDLRTLLTGLPELRHLVVTDSWSMDGCGEVFLDEDVVARLETLELVASILRYEDVVKIAQAPSLSGLKRLHLECQSLAQSRSSARGLAGQALVAIAGSEHLTGLESLGLYSVDVHGLTPEHVEEAAEAGGLQNLTHLSLSGASPESMRAFAELLPVKHLHINYGFTPAHLEGLRGAEVALKKLDTTNLSYSWNGDQSAALEAWLTENKIKHKVVAGW